MNKYEQFKALYKKFIDGMRWLNRRSKDGLVTEQDKDSFNRLVVEPMEALWARFTDEEKDDWLQVMDAVSVFKGTIV